MTTYYVDPAASGSNDGTSWTDAWTNLQSAADTATSGDTVYCRGTQTLTATIDFDTNSGTSGSPIEFIGTNGSGTEDGSYFTLNGNSAASSGIKIDAKDYLVFRNIKITNTTGAGVYGDGLYPDYNLLNNVWVDSAGGDGFYFNHFRASLLFRCKATNNTSRGFNEATSAGNRKYYGCVAVDNGGHGFFLYNGYDVLFNCLAYDNTTYDVRFYSNNNYIVGGVFHGTATGINAGAGAGNWIIGARITGHTNGVSLNGGTHVLLGYNYLKNTTDTNGSPYHLTDNGNDTNVLGGSDTDYGYEDSSADDYNLASGATLRSVAIELD